MEQRESLIKLGRVTSYKKVFKISAIFSIHPLCERLLPPFATIVNMNVFRDIRSGLVTWLNLWPVSECNLIPVLLQLLFWLPRFRYCLFFFKITFSMFLKHPISVAMICFLLLVARKIVYLFYIICYVIYLSVYLSSVQRLWFVLQRLFSVSWKTHDACISEVDISLSVCSSLSSSAITRGVEALASSDISILLLLVKKKYFQLTQFMIY